MNLRYRAGGGRFIGAVEREKGMKENIVIIFQFQKISIKK